MTLLEKSEAIALIPAARTRSLVFMLIGGALSGSADALHVALGMGLDLGFSGIIALLIIGAPVGLALSWITGWPLLFLSRLRRYGGVLGLVLGAVSVLAISAGLDVAAYGMPWLSWFAAFAVYALMLAACWVASKKRLYSMGLVTVVTILLVLLGLRGAGRAEIGKPASVQRPNVLLVTIAGARADRYGESLLETAGMDRLGLEGTTFDLAVTPSQDTPTAVKAVLGLQGQGSLVDAFVHAGYETGAVIGSTLLDRDVIPALTQLDVLDDDSTWPIGVDRLLIGRLAEPLLQWTAPTERGARRVSERAIRFIERRSGAWFLWVHFQDPMPPWTAPEPYAQRHEPIHVSPGPPLASRHPIDAGHLGALDALADPKLAEARYNGEIVWTDEALRDILSTLDTSERAARTLVVVAGLHGLLLDQGDVWFGRGTQLLDAVIHVPLRVRFPSIVAAGAHVAGPVSLADLPATVRDYAGIGTGEGLSLRAQIEGKGIARDHVVVPLKTGFGGAVRASGALLGWSIDQGWYARGFAMEPLASPWTSSRVTGLAGEISGAPEPAKATVASMLLQLGSGIDARKSTDASLLPVEDDQR